MKVRNLLLMGVMGLGLTTACSNEDEVGGGTSPDENGAYAQISISIASSNSTRALSDNKSGDEVEATSEENNINSMRIVFADDKHVAQYVYDPELQKEITTKKNIRSTKPFEVTPGTYNIYVLANYKENESKLSPVVAGMTNMKQEFEIKGDLATSEVFFMTNTTVSSHTITAGIGNETAVDDDGNDDTASDVQKVTLVKMDIERVVGKVTFTTTTNDNKFPVKITVEKKTETEKGESTAAEDDENEDEGETTVEEIQIAEVQITDVSLINLNTKMFLVKKQATTTLTSLPWTNWYYVEDPNYSTASSTDFSKTATASVFTALSSATFYCPENTMSAENQLNGQTTGVVYKATYKPDATNGYTQLLAENGTDYYSVAFAEVLALSDDSRDKKITKTMFTDDLESGTTSGTFYEYKDLIFKNLNAVLLFYAIDKATVSEGESRASAINTAFGKLFESGATYPEVHKYEGGICYYTAWIKHNPDSTKDNEWGKYGVVRNHWYDLTVSGVKSLGHYEPTYKDPSETDDPKKAILQVQATVKKWVAVKQEVILGQ